jgi:primosomal protein N' (replication factor Y) (superfamily II helicase)
VFWDNIIIINSTVTDATKTKYRTAINNWEAKIILGTRSALFYPFDNLWLIIVDEEHDNSYISSSPPRYSSIDIVNQISDLTWAKLILASWTPSIKNMYLALKGNYKIVSLLEKYWHN